MTGLREQPKSVAAFACLVLVLVLLSAFGTEHDGGTLGGNFDELVLQNPAYTLAHFGKLTFPASWFCQDFDLPLVTHPPIHTGLIGYLMGFGFSIYYAEAIPTVLLFVLCLAVIVRSVFPTPVKLGLLFSIGFLATSGETLTLVFGTRPEGDVHAAWLLGLILLESGRLDKWNRFRLFAGAFFLTWASGVHYYAALAFTGVAVYMAWAVFALGWRNARQPMIALCAGGCLFGIPYLAFYLIPYFPDIRATLLQQVQGAGGGVGVSIAKHLDIYYRWSHENLGHPELIEGAMRLGVPLLVFTTAILAAFRSTRGLALAAFPLQFFVLAFTWHKAYYYILHECTLFAAAVTIGLLLPLDYAVRRFVPKLASAVPPLAAAGLSIVLLWRSPMLAASTVSLTPKVHEVEVARAAARQFLGPHARAIGREAAWYTSGAEYWYDLQQDMDPSRLLFDPATYFSNVDAVVDFQLASGPTTPFYADGTLKLRGFFFGETGVQLRLVYLSAHRPAQVVGYVVRNGQLYRFQEQSGGDYEVFSAICPNIGWMGSWRDSFSSMLDFSKDAPGAATYLLTEMAPRSAMYPRGPVGKSCRDISRTPGVLQFADEQALVAGLRRDDPPMHFYRILDDMPGYTGVGLPAAALPPATVPVDGIIDISKTVAQAPGRVQFRPELRVTTGPGLGTFSALIPVNHADSVAGPCWVSLRVQVLAGRVGFAAFDARKGILTRTPEIARSPGPQTIALRVPDFRSATHIAIFNESTVPTGGQIDILDAAILVPKSTPLPVR